MVNLRFQLPLGRLGATYAVHLRIIGKLVVDFLLVVIELISLGAFVLSQFTRLTDGRADIRGYTAPAQLQRGNNYSEPPPQTLPMFVPNMHTYVYWGPLLS